MKSFSEFFTEEAKYNRDQHSKKILKAMNSLRNHYRRINYSSNNRQLWRLVSKYDNLIDYMKEHDREGWIKFCKEHDWSPSHDGYDLLA